MILNLPPSSQIFLADLSRVQDGISRIEQQISSGYKVQKPSDSPDQISALLQLEANLSSNQQVSTNLGVVKAEVDTGENAINTAVQLTEQVNSLGAQGAGSTVTAQSRLSLAQQVESIQEQLVSLTNTTARGRYIFSGDADTVPTYQLDLTAASGVDRLVGTFATRQIEDGTDLSFPVSKTAQELFDHRNPDDTLAADNLFAAVNGLRVALENNDTAGINTALDALRQAATYLNGQQAFYGVTQNRIAAAINSAQNANISLKAQIADIRDTDLSQAALQLTAGETQQQASLAAESKRPRTSLFDFLG